MKWILLFGALLIAFISFRQRPVKVNGNVIRQATVTVVPTQGAGYAEPVKDFKQRATKKLFGTEVTPQDSPVQPERFKGFHTGVDVEYGDVSSPVVVMAIDSGQVVFSRWGERLWWSDRDQNPRLFESLWARGISSKSGRDDQ